MAPELRKQRIQLLRAQADQIRKQAELFGSELDKCELAILMAMEEAIAYHNFVLSEHQH